MFKLIVDEADRSSEGEVTTEVYALKFANPLALSYSIKPIAPNATASPDIYNKTLIVTATAKDHERIKSVIDQADKRGGGDMITKAYSMKWANATTISTALTAVVPDAKISSDAVQQDADRDRECRKTTTRFRRSWTRRTSEAAGNW